ncbi:MBL fold metallo-hydrolase [Frankia sp. CNm7]|uniref:MBL fold metallo-hydrolase n=1 Tax=Frankia nepalensis TaxID=1836974 RepID=A0A937RFC7_9ACTN|nr:MBL fold metallo-hydrolase [Frankia nepalensis]MBL7499664.1 MBL fold metallo-hydrolase [Frankia nepalensis]MBL7514636.1 MBL fold metallo-hydrolase [Frankia nepalensis]MBL7522617.1 MBL fold metallo-hydrolase [Frankia nepalensis]MBL7629390.1 MBL fold metallo-hydrolase [Frankia nepalensis]
MKIGAAVVDRVEEQTFPASLHAITQDEELLDRRVGSLPPGFWDRASGKFQFSCHSWLLRVDGLVVVVDPCTGNGRRLGQAPVFDDLDTPYLERLAEAGAPAEKVNLVFSTHLHHDHCGWNVRLDKGRWVPTFPNAVYLFTKEEYRRWDPANPSRNPNTFNPNVFDQCVRPVVAAGQARVVAPPYQISSSLTIEPAAGHTTGHAMLRLVSEGVRAYFTGDAFHHPVQFARPELHLPGCDDLAVATETRRSLVKRLQEESAFVLPAHFPSPHYGRLGLDDSEVCFLPGGAP